MSPEQAANLVKSLGRQVGLDLVGICRPGPVPRASFYRQWLAQGRAGKMAYLYRNHHCRADTRALLPTARSIIVAAVSYHHPRPEPAGPPDRPRGRMAMYAWGQDYHRVLRGKLAGLLSALADCLGCDFDSRICVDTAPILERELAAAAGLGWIGKNTVLIHPRLGSYLLLGVAFTSLELAVDRPMADRCGTCRRCLQACPTGALYQPYAMDARRCISYLTIELSDSIPQRLRKPIDRWLFGCDLCQQPCPYNRKAPPGREPAFDPGPLADGLDLLEVLGWDQRQYRTRLAGTAVVRASLSMLRRNAAVVLGNVASKAGPQLIRATRDPDPLVRRHAQWALQQLAPGDRSVHKKRPAAD